MHTIGVLTQHGIAVIMIPFYFSTVFASPPDVTVLTIARKYSILRSKYIQAVSSHKNY